MAQYNLGVLYRDGQGVFQDDGEAVTWFRRAAEQDYANAQGALAVMYAQGTGVPEDPVLARMWVSLFLKNVAPGPAREVAKAARNDLDKRLTPAQIADAQWRAREWRPKKP